MMRKKAEKKNDIFFSDQSDHDQGQYHIQQEKGELHFLDDVERKQYIQHFCGNVLLTKSRTSHNCKQDDFFLISPGKTGSGALNWCKCCLNVVKKKSDHVCAEKERISPVLLTTRNQKFIKEFRNEYPILFQIDKKIRNAYLYTILMKIGGATDPIFGGFMNIYRNNLVQAKLLKKNFRLEIFNRKRLRKYLGLPQTRHQLVRIVASNMVEARQRKKWNFQTVQELSCDGFDLSDVSPMEILETFPYFCRLGWYINDEQKLKVLVASDNQNCGKLGQYLFEQVNKKRQFVMDSQLRFYGYDTNCLVGAFASNLPWGTYDVKECQNFLQQYDPNSFAVEGDIQDMVQIDFKGNYKEELFGFEKQVEKNSFYTQCHKIYGELRNLIESIEQNKKAQLKKQKEDIKIGLLKADEFQSILKKNHQRVIKIKEKLKNKVQSIIGDYDILNEAATLSQAILLKELCYQRNFTKNVQALNLLKLPIQTNKNYICSWKDILKRFPDVFKPNHVISKQRFSVRQYEDIQQLNCAIRKRIYERLRAYSRVRLWKKYIQPSQFSKWYEQTDLLFVQRHTIKGSEKIWNSARIKQTDLLMLMKDDGVITFEADGRLQFHIYNTQIMYKGKPFDQDKIQIKILKEEVKELIWSYDIMNLQKQEILTSWLSKYKHNLHWYIIGLHVIYPEICWAKKKRKARLYFNSESDGVMDQALKQLIGLKQIDEKTCYQMSDFVLGENNSIKSFLMDFQKKNEATIDEKLILQYEQMMLNPNQIEIIQQKIKISEDQFIKKGQYYLRYAKSKIQGKIPKNIGKAPQNFIQYFTGRWKNQIGYPQVKNYLLKYEKDPQFRSRINNVENDLTVRFYKEWQIDILKSRKREILDEYAVKCYDQWYFFIGHDLFIMHLDFALQPTPQLINYEDGQWYKHYVQQYFRSERLSPHQLLQVEYNILDKQMPMKNSNHYKSQIKRIQKEESDKYARNKLIQCRNRQIWNDFMKQLPDQYRSFQSVMTLENYPSLVEKGKELLKKQYVEIQISGQESEQRQMYLISSKNRRQKVDQKLQKKKGFAEVKPLSDNQRKKREYIIQQGLIQDDKFRVFDFFINFVRDEISFYTQQTKFYVLWERYQENPDQYKGFQVIHGTQIYFEEQMREYLKILAYKTVAIDSKRRLAPFYRDLLLDKNYCSKLVFYQLKKKMRLLPEKINIKDWIEIKMDQINLPRISKWDNLYFSINGENFHLFVTQIQAVFGIKEGSLSLSSAFQLIQKNESNWIQKRNELEVRYLLDQELIDSQMEQQIQQKIECQKDYDEYIEFDIQKIYQQQQNYRKQKQIESVKPLEIQEIDNYEFFQFEQLQLDNQCPFQEFQPIAFMQKSQDEFFFNPFPEEYQLQKQYIEVEKVQKLVLFEGKLEHKCSICQQNFIFEEENMNMGYCIKQNCKNNEMKIVHGQAKYRSTPKLIQHTHQTIDSAIKAIMGPKLNYMDLKILQFSKKTIVHELVWMGSFPDKIEVYGAVKNQFQEEIKNYFENVNYLPLQAEGWSNKILIKATEDIKKGCILGSLGGQIWKQREYIASDSDKIIEIGMCGDERIVYCSKRFINHAYYLDERYDQVNLSLMWTFYTKQNQNKLGLFFVSNKKIKKGTALRYEV